MAVKIDTYEVRRAARQLGKLADDMQSMSTNKLKTMHTTVTDELRGNTADAMADVLEALSGDTRRIAQSLTTIQMALQKYADEVEEASRKNAELF